MRLLLAALVPVVVYLYAIYKVDKYDKEPKKLLFKLFIAGVFISMPIIFLENILGYMNVFALTTSDLSNAYTAFVVAALTEETFKWLAVKKLAYNNRAYDEKLDGIVYCVFVSLGFAALENILYVFGSGGMSIALLRAMTALPGHMLFGVVMGYYLSKMKFAESGPGYVRASINSLLIPIIVHGIYDYILMSKYKWLLLGFIPYMIWLWYFGIRHIRTYYKVSKEEHLVEEEV